MDKAGNKRIICNCDGFIGLLIKHVILRVIGNQYIDLIQLQSRTEHNWGWVIDDPIPNDLLLKEWYLYYPEEILITSWDWDTTIKAIKKANLENITVYKFCDYKHIDNELPF